MSNTEKEARLIKIREYWMNLPKFEKSEDVPAIPIVDQDEYLDFFIPKLIEAGAIPKVDLIDGQCYIGNHRNATIAKWDAENNVFVYWRHKFNSIFEDQCNHFEDDNKYALFVPIRLSTQEEFDMTGK